MPHVISIEPIVVSYCLIDARDGKEHTYETSTKLKKILNERLPCDDCTKATICDRECRAFKQYAHTGKFNSDDINNYSRIHSSATIKLG